VDCAGVYQDFWQESCRPEWCSPCADKPRLQGPSQLAANLFPLFGLEKIEMRLTDWEALVVCKVDSTKWPVSAALMALES